MVLKDKATRMKSAFWVAMLFELMARLGVVSPLGMRSTAHARTGWRVTPHAIQCSVKFRLWEFSPAAREHVERLDDRDSCF